MNKADSRGCWNFRKMGYTKAGWIKADLALYNTCTIRDNANKVYSFLVATKGNITA